MISSNNSFTQSLFSQLSLNIKEGNLFSLTIRSLSDKAVELKEGKGTIFQSGDNVSTEKLKQSILHQLQNYFSTAATFANIPLAPQGTDFQKSVWNELRKIPLGQTRTYGQIAKILKSSARAVGNACRKNPIAIIIPCHRVVAANGIGGYAGKTQGKHLLIKHELLKHEGINI